jgi:hypothetical protein
MALSLFAKKQPVDDPIPERGGKYVLRQAIGLRLRKKENLQSLVQTINAPQDKILEFANGADNLNEAQLSAVAMYVFGNATYSAELDRLVSTAKPPTSIGVAPAAYNPNATAGVYPPPATPRAEVQAPLAQQPGFVESSKFKGSVRNFVFGRA